MGGLTRKAGLLFLLFGIGLHGFAANPISVDELERLLATASAHHDAQLARKLSNLKLTQRLNSIKLSHWLNELPGEKEQQALLAHTSWVHPLRNPGDRGNVTRQCRLTPVQQ